MAVICLFQNASGDFPLKIALSTSIREGGRLFFIDKFHMHFAFMKHCLEFLVENRDLYLSFLLSLCCMIIPEYRKTVKFDTR